MRGIFYGDGENEGEEGTERARGTRERTRETGRTRGTREDEGDGEDEERRQRAGEDALRWDQRDQGGLRFPP